MRQWMQQIPTRQTESLRGLLQRPLLLRRLAAGSIAPVSSVRAAKSNATAGFHVAAVYTIGLLRRVNIANDPGEML